MILPLRLLDRAEPPGDQGSAAELAWLLARSGNGRIRCPGCGWIPTRDSRWSCVAACGTCWNTFDTRARCPGCDKQWEHTACLRCHGWFLHRDWYLEAEGAGPAGQ